MPKFFIGARQGARSTMEDRHLVSTDLLQDGGSIQMVAVFDGHGGSNVVALLHRYFENVLRHTVLLAQDAASLRDEKANYTEALQKAFAACDEMIYSDYATRRETDGWWCSDSGSTAAVVLIVGGKELYCANVGDTEVVLGTRLGSTQALSVVHKPSVPEERKRIESAGGSVIHIYGVARVNAVLAVSRAFGNCSLGTGTKPIDAVPSISHRAMDGSEQVLIVASDGLWDVFTHAEAIRYAFELLDRGHKNCAQMLTETAVNVRNSRDNVTTVVVHFSGANGSQTSVIESCD